MKTRIGFSLLILFGLGFSACAPLPLAEPTFVAPATVTLTPLNAPTEPASELPSPTVTAPDPDAQLWVVSATPSVLLASVTPESTLSINPWPTASQKPHIERVPPSAEPILGEAPAEVLQRVLDAARAHLGLPADAPVIVLRAEAVTWPDGALGCPQPGMTYTQAEVEGYWIVVDAGGQVLDYRVSDTGYPWLCVS